MVLGTRALRRRTSCPGISHFDLTKSSFWRSIRNVVPVVFVLWRGPQVEAETQHRAGWQPSREPTAVFRLLARQRLGSSTAPPPPPRLPTPLRLPTLPPAVGGGGESALGRERRLRLS